MTIRISVPDTWDRRGLPAWTYHSPALFAREMSEIFHTHWQIAGHVGDVPGAGDWITFDMLDERALIMRGQDGTLRAFHNLCRHRGARLADGASGHCRGVLVCPFHGWVYNTDGSLRGPARPDSFDAIDPAQFGLKPIEMQVWHGFIFVRFAPGPQPDVADLMAPFDADFAAYRADQLVPAESGTAGTDPGGWRSTLPVNWKSVRDVDNEGYHVAMAHPGLQDLYGRSYEDHFFSGGQSASYATYGDQPGRGWSVRHYIAHSPLQDWLPQRLQRAWTYYGVFPTGVIAFTPEGAQYYQDIPVGLNETELRGRLYRHPHETRQARIARYLGARIDRDTSLEDRQLSIWSNEAMKSAAFDGFHLSDLEYGLRNHHDQIRRILPVTTNSEAPPEDIIATADAESVWGSPKQR